MEGRFRQEEPGPSIWVRSFIAVAFSAAAFALRYVADPWLGPQQAFTTAFAAVAFAAWYGTWRAGLLCAVLSFFWGEYFFVAPRHHLLGMSAEKAIESVFYWALVAVILYISHRATKSRLAAKHLIERLQAADARKSDFLAMVAHEMKSPLSAIGSALQLLERAGPLSEKQEQASAVIARQAAQMNRLVDDLFDAARIQQGKVDLKLERATVADLVAAALEAVGPALREKRQRHEVRIADDVPELLVDPARMYQVLTNLLTNASRYSPEESLVRIEARRVGAEVCICVTDSGTGIALSKLDWVFDTYSQVRPGGQGLGLGLSLVRRLVQLHGGSVRALSRGEGEGTRFEIRLPVADH